jgi:hypothetical protein
MQIRNRPPVERRSIAEHFWSKVNKGGPDDCWMWKNPSRAKGKDVRPSYHIHFPNNRPKGHIASRIAYELSWGYIKKGLQVLHRCDNPGCVNPNHLFLGTQADNIRDMMEKDRQSFFGGKTKMSEQQVLELRYLRDHTGMTLTDLAERYKIRLPAVSAIVKRRSWKHI